MRIAICCLIIAVTGIFTPARADVVLDFWHSYTSPQTGQIHYNFHLSDYKHGLFLGSCGFNTKSLQWAYQFNLTADGPVYGPDQFVLSNDSGTPLKVISGSISIDGKQSSAVIAIEIEQGGTTNKFIGNGKHAIRKLK